MSSQPSSVSAPPEPARPWWTYKMLWLVIAGPLLVVIASLVSAYIAVHGQDPVLLRDEVPESQAGKTQPDALTPAVQARNHAATVEQSPR